MTETPSKDEIDAGIKEIMKHMIQKNIDYVGEAQFPLDKDYRYSKVAQRLLQLFKSKQITEGEVVRGLDEAKKKL